MQEIITGRRNVVTPDEFLFPTIGLAEPGENNKRVAEILNYHKVNT